jgi:hypothetical protein
MNSVILSDSGTVSPTMWMAYAMGLLTILYAVFVRPKMKEKKDPLARMPGQSRGNLSRQRDVEKQMETLLVELSEMARQITAQLDTRSAKLEVLIREADEKIAALQNVPAKIIDPPTPAAAGRDIPATDDPRHAAVYALADNGLSANQIAQRLKRPSGEVELILALRPGK